MNGFELRLQRTVNAIEMKPVDKIPFSYNGPAYLARECGISTKTAITDYPRMTEAVLQFLHRHAEIDTIHSPLPAPYALSTLWFSPVRCPGKELPDEELWQVEERESIHWEDYETILKEGFGPWSERVLKERLNDPFSKMLPFLQSESIAYQRLQEHGFPVMNGALAGTPFENFCGGRTLMNFFLDLVEEPELIKQVLDKAMEHMLSGYEAQLTGKHPFGAWVGGWRAAPEMLSHDTWMEFVWPYLKKLILLTIAHGVVPILHFDSCWDRELETLNELPPRKCILMLDGTTDMRKARSVLDDRMCLMGDVPASLLAFGSENDVYEYTTKLIDDVGPKTGLIVSSGCDTPANAKFENVNAMIRAAAEYRS